MAELARARFQDFRGFTDLTIELERGVKLVVLAGPNGLGKSSVFDGFRTWQGRTFGINWDPQYHGRAGSARQQSYSNESAEVQIYDWPPSLSQEQAAKAFYFRTAYRFEPDFNVGAISAQPQLVGPPRINKMSDPDTVVSQNYQALLASAVRELFDQSKVQTTEEVRNALVADLSAAMARLFGSLQLQNLSDPLRGGAFYFRKNSSERWHYKNLSGGERAAFDLLLDVSAKRIVYDDTIYCIDEPELHLNTRVQAALLDELLKLLPERCQLWIATHSIGMMRAAQRRASINGDVAFLDFEQVNGGQPCTLKQIAPDREFWKRTLRVALDDLSDLVAPRVLVVVEGEPAWTRARRRANLAFDARILAKIFASEFPDVEFMSVGGSDVVENDKLELANTAAVIANGMKVIRVVDLDDRSPGEVEDAKRDGLRVLRYRDIENFLLADEILIKLCASHGQENVAAAAIQEKARLLNEQVANHQRPADDVKNVRGPLFVWLKQNLAIRQGGNNFHHFALDTLAPLMTPDTTIYQELRDDVLGAS